MKLRLLTAADLESALPMGRAIEAMREAYAELSRGDSLVPQRLAVPVAEVEGVTLVKPALTRDGLGAKLVSVFPGNRQRGLEVTVGLMVLLDRETGHPVGLCDGTFLTALRTGAAAGVATDLLARRDVSRAALIGCGGQARTLVLAMDSVRALELVQVFARTQSSVELFIAQMQPRLRARLHRARSPEEALEGAELVTTATTSPVPVFDGRLLAAGTHVNAIGSFTAAMQEVDTETIRRCRVFVDSRSAARAEAGELLAAERAGVTRPEEWTEIGEVVNAMAAGRLDDQELTLFKSVGVAVQDVKAASVAFARAREESLGSVIEF